MLATHIALSPLLAQQLPFARPPESERMADPALARLPWKQPTASRERRSRALAHFGQGRLHERHGRLPQAIGEFQKAWFWDPSSPAALDLLIPLCFQTEQAELAYRYADICLDKGWDSIAPLRGIAFHAVLSEPTEQAWQVYEQVIAKATESGDSDQLVGLHYDRTRMAFIDKTYAVALPSAEFLLMALAQPELYDVEETTREDVWGDLTSAYALIGEVFFHSQQLSKAETAFRQAAKSAQEDTKEAELALLHFRLARVRQAQHRSAEAAQELDLYLTSDSRSAGISAYGLLEQLNQETTDVFRKQLERLSAEQPANKTLLHFLGDHYLRHKKSADAVAVFEQLAEWPEDELAQQQLIASYAAADQPGPFLAALGRIVRRYGDVELVDKQLEAALADEAFARAALDEAERRLRDDKRRMLWSECVALAFCCQRMDQPQRADAFVQAALDRAENRAALAGSLFALGMEYLLADQIPTSIRRLQASIDADPNGEETADLHYYLALAYQLDDQLDAALKTINAAADSERRPLAVSIRRARILFADNQLQEARRQFADAIARFDDQRTDVDLRRDLLDARVTLASVCSELADYDAAEKWLIEAVCEFPGDAGAKNDLGYLWADQNQHLDLARQMIEEAVADEPDNVAFIDSLGWVLYRLGLPEQALQPLERAAAAEDADGIILDHLGDVYDRLGRHTDAMVTWEKAIGAFQQTEQEDKIDSVKQKISKAESRQE